jgi:peptidoglycan glycosyltransferase
VGVKSGLKRGKDFYGLSLTLGGGEVTPLELTTAYNTLASGGRYYAPVSVLKITDANGTVLEEFLPNPGQQVLDPSLAAIMSDMLSDDRARQAVWGLNSPLRLSLPAAVKTGTTNDWRDAWAAGYTPFVTVGVWTGNNNNEPTARVESLTGGGIIWRNVMEEIFSWIQEEPRYRALFAAPYADSVIPTEFQLPDDGSVQRKSICALPGSYGGYSDELFSRTMLTRLISSTVNLEPGPALDARLRDLRIPCDAFERVTVVRIPAEEEWTADGQLQIGAPPERAEEGEEEDQGLPPGNYCRPVEGVNYPEGLRRTLYVWNTPPSDPDMRVRYEWQGGSAGVQLDELPACEAAMFEPPTPVPPVAGAILMPDLERLGENQAKELLASLGVSAGMVYVDYQTRDRIPELFDQYVPYSVVSTLPRAGDWIMPGTTIILGVRAPDEAPQTAPEPTAPPAGEPPPQTEPTAPPQPTAPPPQEPPPEAQPQPTPQPGLPLPPTLPQPLPPPGGRP